LLTFLLDGIVYNLLMMVRHSLNFASKVCIKNPYRYRGYRYDTETGLYYLKGNSTHIGSLSKFVLTNRRFGVSLTILIGVGL
jgi:hypothetical protein